MTTPGVCTAAVDTVACPEPAAYVVALEDCATCRVRLGSLFCIGIHPVCVPHGAQLRADGLSFTYEGDDGPADVARIYEAAAHV